MCICGLSTQQWPSTQITLFERTRKSMWLDDVTTPVDKKRISSCVWKHLLEGVQPPKIIAKELGNSVSDALRPPVSCFQNSEAGNMKPLFALFYWLMNELPYLFWSKDSEKLFTSLLPRPANNANFWRECVCLSPGQNSLWIQVTSFTVKQILL